MSTAKPVYQALSVVSAQSNYATQWQSPTSGDTRYAEFYPRTGYRGFLARAVFVTPILAMAGLEVYLIRWGMRGEGYTTGTGLFCAIVWVIFTLITSVILIINLLE